MANIMAQKYALLAGIFAGAIVMCDAGELRADDWSPLWATANLSQARGNLCAAAVGGKAFFAGGIATVAGVDSNVVDIYDLASNSWSTATLSQARYGLAAAGAGNTMLFAGGDTATGNSASNVVDIYNISAGTWSTSTLSVARRDLAAASNGTKVYIGGGYLTNNVDIYDISSGKWSISHLSVARNWLAATAVNDKVIFAGGFTNTAPTTAVDIDNVTGGSWSTANLTSARYVLSAATAGGKAFFGGGDIAPGTNPSNVVDVYDAASGTWAAAALSVPRSNLAATALGSKVFFAGGRTSNGNESDVVDIFDTATNTWSTAHLSQARGDLAATSVGNKAFFGGGYRWTNGLISSVLDIYTAQNYTSITSTKTFTLVDNTTVAGLMQLNGGSLGLAGYMLDVGSMGGNAPIDLSSGTLTTGTDNTSTTYSGALRGGGRLVKTGSGILTLSGPNTYSGSTNVNQGKFLVNGSLASPVTVNSGSTLGGTGSLSSVLVNSGGHLAPGDAPGTLTLSSSLTLLSGAKMDYELDTPLDSDLIVMSSSALTLNGQQFSDFNFTPLAAFGPGAYTLIDAGLISGSLGSGTSGVVNGLPASLAIQGNDLVLNVVPEPSSLLLLTAAAVLILGRAWRFSPIDSPQILHKASAAKSLTSFRSCCHTR